MKAQFREQRPATESAAPDLPLGAPIARPLSITIIGWFLLIGSAIAPLHLLFSSRFFSGGQLPLFFLDFFLFGHSAFLILIVWMAAQMVAAVGLLKLKKWGLCTTIGLQCLRVMNAALLVGVPANRAKFQQLIDAMMASTNVPMAQSIPFVFPVWIGIAISVPMVFVILYLLITRKQAFTSAAKDLARQRSEPCSSSVVGVQGKESGCNSVKERLGFATILDSIESGLPRPSVTYWPVTGELS